MVLFNLEQRLDL